ncbi:hypothetical protein MW887_006521 [Aspergillus wentii]|nr:hypothetical protein MW887_006521 [Aspergillus wentii]
MAVVYDSLVEDFKAYATREPTREQLFRDAIASAIHPANGGAEEMKAEDIATLEDYFRYCHDLLRWVPTVSTTGDELLRKLLVFYWVFNQPTLQNYQNAINPGSIRDDPKWLSYWLESDKWQDPPEGGWESFNQFFSRKWKNIDDARPIKLEDQDEKAILSVADSTFHGHWDVVQGDVTLKGVPWPIEKLLQNTAGEFATGSFMHAFLGPTDYHRQHAPVTGTVVESRIIQEQVYLEVTMKQDGMAPNRGLFVNKIKDRSDAKDFKDLDAPDTPGYQWCQTRGLIVIETENHGKVAVLPIGMAQVSSVVLKVKPGDKVNRGDEISYFQFGGSDVVLVFQQPVGYNVEPNTKCNVRTRVATFHS